MSAPFDPSLYPLGERTGAYLVWLEARVAELEKALRKCPPDCLANLEAALAAGEGEG